MRCPTMSKDFCQFWSLLSLQSWATSLVLSGTRSIYSISLLHTPNSPTSSRPFSITSKNSPSFPSWQEFSFLSSMSFPSILMLHSCGRKTCLSKLVRILLDVCLNYTLVELSEMICKNLHLGDSPSISSTSSLWRSCSKILSAVSWLIHSQN